MNMARMLRTLMWILIMLVLGATAGAVDMTGTWAGRERCACFNPTQGNFTERYKDEVMEITQDGTDLNILFFDELFNGNVIDHPGRSSRGEASLIACETDATDNTRFGEIARAKVWAKDGGRGKLTINSLWNAHETQICTCTSRLRRTDSADPEIGDCASAKDTVDAWHARMLDAPPTTPGCHEVEHPETDWQAVSCGDAAKTGPLLPARALADGASGRAARKVGGYTPGYMLLPGKHLQPAQWSHLFKVTGSFETNNTVTSIADPHTPLSTPQNGGENIFTLQLNTSRFSSPACPAYELAPSCQGWQQFVYEARGSGKGNLWIQYWLVDYNSDKVTCPPSVQFADGTSGDWRPVPHSYHCVFNSHGWLNVDPVTASQLGDLHLTGIATPTEDHIILRVGNKLHHHSPLSVTEVHPSDTILGLEANWSGVEFNVVGDGNGTEAVFNPGASVDVMVSLDFQAGGQFQCTKHTTTAESNDLTLATPNQCTKLRNKTPMTYTFTQEKPQLNIFVVPVGDGQSEGH